MLTIGGVSAEEIDGFSSVVAESPVSAELDNSLSSYDASYDELSTYESYASDCEGFRHGDESLAWSDADSYEYSSCIESEEDVQSFELSGLSESFESNISCGYVNSSCCCGLQISCDSVSSDDFKTVDVSGSDICESYACQLDDVCCAGEMTPVLGVVDENVIVDDCIYYSGDDNAIRSTNSLDKSCISHLKSLTRYDELRSTNPTSEISRVAVDMEASTSDNLGIDANPQIINFLKSIGDCGILDELKHYLQEISRASEPAFDDVLVTSGYISDGEVYFGTISDTDREMLLKYIGAERVILFAGSVMDCNFDEILRILNNATLCQQMGEVNLAGCKSAKGLLKYRPSTNEIYISLIDDSEDEHDHVINDTNSHGLDYAYIKHVNVIYKDMPNLMVLSSSGDIENSTEGSWDSLNDVLGSSMSSETLLPDHKAIWTPLLLLLQQDLQESIVNSHADDNWDKTINKADTDDTDNDDINWSNITPKGWVHDYEKWLRDHGWYSNYNGYDYYAYQENQYSYEPDYYCHEPDNDGDMSGNNASKPKDGLANSTGNVTDSSKNKHDNSTDDKNESSNVTSTANQQKSVGNPKAIEPASEPTYTLVYAIIGIAFVSILFNSGYMKRDD